MPRNAKKPRPKDLHALIESTPSTNVKKMLLTALPGLSDDQLKTLREVFAPISESSQVEKHCVRCHEVFYDHTNDPRACKIEHGSEGDGERTEVGDDAITVTLFCCGLQYDMEEGLPRGSPCRVSPHTTEPIKVDYYDAEISDEPGNENVVTCEEKGCAKPKRKVVPRKANPVKKRKVRS